MKQGKTPVIVTLMATRGLIFTKAEQTLEQELLNNGQVPFILRTDNEKLPDCRNTLVKTALEVPEWTHALLIDDDVIIPDGGLKALLKLNTDIGVIDYPMHYSQGRWAGVGTATYDDWLPGEKYTDKPLAWAGLGCCLVKREVFEKMTKPYFIETERTFTRDDDGHITLNEDRNDFGGGGEDVYFMLKAKELGFKLKMVKGLTAGHARLVRAVLALQENKYRLQHKIAVNDFVEKPYR